MRKGLPHLPGHVVHNVIDTEGVCQFYLLISYGARFLSVWIIVSLTIERYTVICYPIRSRIFTSKTLKVVATLGALSLIFSVTKASISGIHETVPGGEIYKCTYKPGYKAGSFILDYIFALFTTLVPFFVIACLNVMIIKNLNPCIGRNTLHASTNRVFGSRLLRHQVELTVTLLTISTSFVLLNLPYFVAWLTQHSMPEYRNMDTFAELMNDHQQLQGFLLISKTIYYLNFCSNFFLYCITGSNYRRALISLFQCHHETHFIHDQRSTTGRAFSTQVTSLSRASLTSTVYSGTSVKGSCMYLTELRTNRRIIQTTAE
ncbi:unnamed protein product [Owenia fusiformis]|uniref:Uncharacterized protein n=1 Tax=Owenia fusiformis TaxID=6347 RepID=A0A8J1UE29_OWEFU|nr:unnamed protein product [Owenia fusiformis]